VSFALRHRISVLLVLCAFLTVSGVFLFARPEYQPRYESEMLDFSKQRHYGPDAVRDAFVAKGVRLRVASRFNGMLILSNEPRPLEADALHVIIGPRRGTGSWGSRLQPYDERFGNVLVTYGGRDEQLLDGVRAAVAALR
jgi:hypothetical protein